MKNVFAVIGATFVLLSIAGAIIPGFSYHVFAGTTDKAMEWHKEQFKKLESDAK